MKHKYHYPYLISGYKILISFLRVYIGLLLIIVDYNLNLLTEIFFDRPKMHTETLFYYLSNHIVTTPKILTIILAFSLIIISSIEIFLAIALIFKRRWGGIGLFITCIAWVPVEILFVSKFLLIHKTMGIIINIIILLALAHLIKSNKDYFKK